ncbi:MAG: glycosyltransferase [bacterium]
MKIAFFADSYKPYLSGVTNSAEILVNELRALGHKVYVFAPHYPGHVDADPDIFRFPSIAGGYPKFRLAIPFIRKVPEIDLIHSHSPFQAGLLARYIARKKGVPFVYSFHTLFTRYVHYARFVPKKLAKMGIVAYLRSFCGGADAVITPSAMARRVLLKWQVDRPIHVIPSGVELSLYPRNAEETRKNLRNKYGLLSTDKVLLYVGRLSKEKNLPFIVKAFEQLAVDGLRLVLVGGGPLEKELRKHHHKNIIVTGEVPYPEILRYYFIGDVFVFSSLTETQGLVLAEAKGAGLPIVALFAGGLTDAVRGGTDGYLLPRRQDVYVEHLGRLLKDGQLREKMGRAARDDARERFSSLAVAKQTESLYNFLIEKS